MIRRPPRSTLDRSSAASDVYKRQPYGQSPNHRPRDYFSRLLLSAASNGNANWECPALQLLTELWSFSKLLQTTGSSSRKLHLGRIRNQSFFIGLHPTIWPHRGSYDPAN